jgi:acetamidase/formamidase
MEFAATIHVPRNQFHLAWDRTIPPYGSVPSGGVVAVDAFDASCGQLTSASTAADLARVDWSRGNPVAGPIAVDGAMPGDALEVEFLAFEPAHWGWTASIPGFGLLADAFPDPILRLVSIGRGESMEFLPGLHIPLQPFCGEVGVAPEAGRLSLGPPDLHGGNIDTRELTAGATLYLPVFAEGALFSIGDGHAAQGDGEVCGTAVETAMRATVRLTVRKDLKVAAPEFVTPDRSGTADRSGPCYATNGIGPDLHRAARDATSRMIDWMGRSHGIAPADAYLLCSVAVDLRISEIVDLPNVIVTAYCPLQIFE